MQVKLFVYFLCQVHKITSILISVSVYDTIIGPSTSSGILNIYLAIFVECQLYIWLSCMDMFQNSSSQHAGKGFPGMFSQRFNICCTGISTILRYGFLWFLEFYLHLPATVNYVLFLPVQIKTGLGHGLSEHLPLFLSNINACIIFPKFSFISIK